MGRGQPVAFGYADEYNPQAVRRFLEPLVQRLGVSVIVTDDLASFRQVTQKLGVEHQVCQFHVRRWVGQAVHELKENLPPEWVGVAEEVRQILRDLPPEGDKRLVAFLRQFPPSSWSRSGEAFSPLDKLRLLIVRLAENWAKFRVFDWQDGVPNPILGAKLASHRYLATLPSAAYLLSSAFAAPMWGILMDRIGRRNAITTGLLMGSRGTYLFF